MKTIQITPEVEIYAEVVSRAGNSFETCFYAAAIARSSIDYPLGTLAIIAEHGPDGEPQMIGTIESGNVFLEDMSDELREDLLKAWSSSEICVAVVGALKEAAQ